MFDEGGELVVVVVKGDVGGVVEGGVGKGVGGCVVDYVYYFDV